MITIFKKPYSGTIYLLAAICMLLSQQAFAAISTPLVINSSTHPEEQVTALSDISLTWNTLTPGVGSIVTFEYLLDTNASHNHTTFTSAFDSDVPLKSGSGNNIKSVLLDKIEDTDTDIPLYFHLRAYDASGIIQGTGPTSYGPIEIYTDPSITSISDPTLSHTLSKQVTISGTFFVDGATVKLINGDRNGTVLPDVTLTNVQFVDQGSLTASIPTGVAPGTYDLKVTNTTTPQKQFDTLFDAFESTNNAPVANAGENQTLTLSGASVSLYLNGSGSTDADSDTITSYVWTKVSEPVGSSLPVPSPSVTPSAINLTQSGTYEFSLTVTDEFEKNSPADTISITVSSGSTNNPPIAEAGGTQIVPLNTQVTLSGSNSSDPDDDPLTSYLWNLDEVPETSDLDSGTVGGNNITSKTEMTAYFTPDAAGDYTVSLTVSDGNATSTPDIVTITANTRPIADAGPDASGIVGEQVQLDGTNSYDDDNDTLTYLWSITSQPAGSSIALSPSLSAPQPTFTPTHGGTYEFSLTVEDDDQTSTAPDTVIITTNTRPVADAGTNSSAAILYAKQLDGTGSYDDDNDTLTYLWSVTSVPGGSTITVDSLSDETAPQPTFTPDLVGDYVFSLTVNDGELNSASAATVTITAVTGFTVTHNYVVGWNLVPLSIDGVYSTSTELEAAIESNNPGISVTRIMGWDKTGQTFKLHQGPLTFALSAGESYFVLISGGTGSLSFSGPAYSSTTIVNGFSALAIEPQAEGVLATSTDLENKLETQAGSTVITRILGWDKTGQTFKLHQGPLTFSLDVLVDGVLVLSTSEFTYTP